VTTQIDWIGGYTAGRIGLDLGIIYSSSTVNTYFIPAVVYDPQPYTGPVTYNLIGGNLPDHLTLDSTTGYIWGTLTNITSYETFYFPVIEATKHYSISNTTTTISSTFTLTVRNYDQSEIEWVTTPYSLRTLTVGEISDLSIKATLLHSTGTIHFSGSIQPPYSGLTLQSDGTITGVANQAERLDISVVAVDSVSGASIGDLFFIQVVSTATQYTNIYLKPLLKSDQKDYYQSFITSSTIFNPDFIYRPFDPNFGIQPYVKMVLEYGIQELNLDQYVLSLQENFYKRRFTFGDVKYYGGSTKSGDSYDAVYVEIVDNIKGSPLALHKNNNIYYPASIDNMRTNLSSIELNSGETYIDIKNDLQPSFMKQYQSGELYNYIPVLVICYALPGYGRTIVNRIKESGFDFKLIDFEIDRIYVQNTLDYPSTKYLLLPRNNISQGTSHDASLYGNDGVEWSFDDNDTITIRD